MAIDHELLAADKACGFFRVDMIRPHGTRHFDGTLEEGTSGLWVEQLLIGLRDHHMHGHRNDLEGLIYGATILEFNEFFGEFDTETNEYVFEWRIAHFMTE